MITNEAGGQTLVGQAEIDTVLASFTGAGEYTITERLQNRVVRVASVRENLPPVELPEGEEVLHLFPEESDYVIKALRKAALGRIYVDKSYLTMAEAMLRQHDGRTYRARQFFARLAISSRVI